ncbi:MAG: C39 family peptidase [Phascolarctobacterium sp.]|nr:C39 family peptidase [Phascolarctobacterium sp.]
MKYLKVILGVIILAGVLFTANWARNFLFSKVNEGTSTTGGAAAHVTKHDIKNSPYFPALDFYNMKSNDHLTILSNFKTYQQTTGYTCGPAAAYMVVEHYLGKCPQTEMEIAKAMDTNNHNGTSVKGMMSYFEKVNWEVHSSTSSKTPKNYDAFVRFVEGNLKQNNPIMVENVEWGGHWRVIIGYDSMGTDYKGDDVLIMADPFDLADHHQDGYNIEPAEKFYYMWFDSQLFSSFEKKNPWLIAKPKVKK